jgi:oligopeptide transport system substrate-binding protein
MISCSLTQKLSLGLAALLMCSPAFGAGLSQTERRQKGEVYMNMGDEPPSMDPTKQADTLSGMWLGHIYEGLMTPDKTGKNYIPGAAESMQVSADGKTYTFKIRKNAKWHDGKPVKAQDFEFAFRRLVDPKFASEYSFIAVTAQIAGADEIIKGKKPITELGARALNDSTFEVKLNNAVSFFPSLMAFSVFFPVRKDIVEKFGEKFAANADSIIGNGPFKLTSWVHEASMRIEKAPTYWNAADVKLNAIEAPVLLKDPGASYSQFATGGLDMVGLDRDRLKIAQKDKLAIKNYQDGGVFWLDMNQRKGKLFSNVTIRQALRFALNRNELVNKVLAVPGTKPAYGIVPDYMPGSKTGSSFRKESGMTWKDGDTASAKKFIQEYLQATKQTKVPPFTILGDDGTNGKMQAEYLQSYLKNIFNTEIKIDLVPFKTRLQRMRDGDFDIVWAGWGPDYLDSMTFMDLFMSNNENNHGEFKDAKFDAMIKQAQVESDAAKRIKILLDAEKYLILEQAAVIPYFQRGRAYVSANGLQGFLRSQVGSDPNFRYASWK